MKRAINRRRRAALDGFDERCADAVEQGSAPTAGFSRARAALRGDRARMHGEKLHAALAKRFALVPSPQEQREFRLGVGFHAVVPSVVVYFAEPNTFRIREAIDFAGDVDDARARRIKRFQEQLR